MTKVATPSNPATSQQNLLLDASGNVKGIPKSGRPWKANKQRFSSMGKDKPLKSSWERKMAAKKKLNSLKTYQAEIGEARRQEKLEYRRRVEAHKKTKEENQRKSEVVQVITNPAKIKRMKKKQLRMLRTADTCKTKTVKM